MSQKSAEKLWIMGRCIDHTTYSWEMCGLFSTEQQAKDACFDEGCFIGPVKVGDNLAKRNLAWFNTYYPSVNGKKYR